MRLLDLAFGRGLYEIFDGFRASSAAIAVEFKCSDERVGLRPMFRHRTLDLPVGDSFTYADVHCATRYPRERNSLYVIRDGALMSLKTFESIVVFNRECS